LYFRVTRMMRWIWWGSRRSPATSIAVSSTFAGSCALTQVEQTPEPDFPAGKGVQ
jgi:hypothetical protein